MDIFKMKTEIRFGDGALESLSEFQAESAVIITDAFMVKSGAAEKISQHLKNCKKVSIFGDVKPNPPIELVAEGLKFLNSSNADLVIALGGGSSIDAAKSVLFMAKQNGKKMPLVAIPTTSGTGSEVTKFAVVTDLQAGIKYPLVSDDLLPEVAILDASLVMSAPPAITADTGFDAITHAIEAYVSTEANDFSDAMAEKATALAFEYLLDAYHDGTNVKAREKMHSASCLAGLSFSEVSLGINHGIAHALGVCFHIPHGRANAMLLPIVIEYNAALPGTYGGEVTEAAKRYAKLAKLVGLPCPNVRAGVMNLVHKLNDMLKRTKTPLTLGQQGVTGEQFATYKDKIIHDALQDACTSTNPRKVTAEDVANILNHLAKW